ncbi:MAG: hypothetical protein ABS70_00075 [Nitrospira sp. SCN 59-13]|nr:MAG: hypothetical protein ABS70_00075 [Nitrospira sp. SCN 59-13]
MSLKAVFLDKDGTIIEDDVFTRQAGEIRLMSGSEAGLHLLHRGGYALIVVTNQGGIAQGRLTIESLMHEERGLQVTLSAQEIPLAGFYYCPHHPEGSVASLRRHCMCRKPKPGLLMKAADELHIDLHRSWMIGDILNDVEAGRGAGCKTILLTNGHETEWDMKPTRWPDFLADNLLEAAHLIMIADHFMAGGEHPSFGSHEEDTWI